jgi:two-component system C4-dicarboxylate transport sensor histidine kinase DctB
LQSQLQRYQEMVVLLSDHPALNVLAQTGQKNHATADALLLEAADKTAALTLFFADAQGRILASAHGKYPDDLTRHGYFRRAMNGALGKQHGSDEVFKKRVFYFAAPSFGNTRKVQGALVVVVDIERLETDWRGRGPAVFFSDDKGAVFISNRSELLPLDQTLTISDAVGSWPVSIASVGMHEVWKLDWGPYLPRQALHLTQSLPAIGMTAEALIDVAPALRLAGLQAMMMTAAVFIIVALLFFTTERRRSLSTANITLERRVSERTQALSDINRQLRREISERQDAEAALQQAQTDLVQAEKLTALGKLSAGISHELNQPLMAIQQFATNGAEFLERGRPARAADNLTRIAELAHRMGRIIKNLRAFVRNESEPVSRVDIVAVIDGALELSTARFKRAGIAVHWQSPQAPVWVQGGDVRLGQVMANLFGNAIDAMAGQKQGALEVTLVNAPDHVLITVADTGPGIAQPEKLFEPFYSTKEVGSDEGMGLGLSISYGLLQSFGGKIAGRNRSDHGAEFIIELVHATTECIE